jgi:ElaB/YqjD/DUF883 family membrane-anchored ribosome-binding protein
MAALRSLVDSSATRPVPRRHFSFTYSKGNAMDHTSSTGGSLTGGTRPNPANPNANPLGAKVESAAQTAHQTTDKLADKAATQADRLSGTAHRAIDSATDAASSAAEWASSNLEQAKQVQAQLTEAASASIRARPIATVAGALFVGYLLGRLARL